LTRLINRTLVYGLLTALLAGLYAGAVLVLGQLFGGSAEIPRAGGGRLHLGRGRLVPAGPPPLCAKLILAGVLGLTGGLALRWTRTLSADMIEP
jgi:hypothetical protein